MSFESHILYSLDIFLWLSLFIISLWVRWLAPQLMPVPADGRTWRGDFRGTVRQAVFVWWWPPTDLLQSDLYTFFLGCSLLYHGFDMIWPIPIYYPSVVLLKAIGCSLVETTGPTYPCVLFGALVSLKSKQIAGSWHTTPEIPTKSFIQHSFFP